MNRGDVILTAHSDCAHILRTVPYRGAVRAYCGMTAETDLVFPGPTGRRVCEVCKRLEAAQLTEGRGRRCDHAHNRRVAS
jgi:hypothetical protein